MNDTIIFVTCFPNPFQNTVEVETSEAESAVESVAPLTEQANISDATGVATEALTGTLQETGECCKELKALLKKYEGTTFAIIIGIFTGLSLILFYYYHKKDKKKTTEDKEKETHHDKDEDQAKEAEKDGAIDPDEPIFGKNIGEVITKLVINDQQYDVKYNKRADLYFVEKVDVDGFKSAAKENTKK